jgi:hypothetical protein
VYRGLVVLGSFALFKERWGIENIWERIIQTLSHSLDDHAHRVWSSVLGETREMR